MTDRNEWIPTNPGFDPGQPMQIGGQAVIEGVMMRAPGSVATAVRRRNGEIAVRKEQYASLNEKYGLRRIPVLRGAVGLIDMMYLGIKTLNWSAEIAVRDEEPSKGTKGSSVEKRGRESRISLLATMVFALALGIGIFFVTPLFLASLLFDIEQTAIQFNLVAGLFRIVILLSYLAVISLMPDIRRLFQYHGAEHMAVFTFELNDQLVVSDARKHSRFHPRCGTSFLLIVMFVAIISFALLDFVLIGWLGEMTLPLRLVTHLPFIPIVGGIAYEVIKFSARHSTTSWGQLIVAPGLWLQRITTREPDEPQLEVALVALRCALGIEDAGRYPLTEDVRVEEAA